MKAGITKRRLLTFLLLFACVSVRAQNTNQVAPTQSLADLQQHRKAWPAQVTLKSAIKLVITSNGKEVGSIGSPEGSTVDLISVDETTLEVGVGAARAAVTPDQTDLWQRVAATQSPPPIPAPTAPPTPLTPTPLHAPPPASPAPAPPPTPAAAPAPTSGAPLLLEDEVSPRDNFTTAAFRFWSPAYAQPIRAIIVLVPGLRGDGRGMVDDSSWQALAQKYRLALVGCNLIGPGNYYEAPNGTGDALLEALKKFGEQSNHPEVATAPLLLYGESAGGQFDYDFVLWKPERVMAFVVNKGGYYDSGSPDNAVCAVPGLFFLGLADSDLRINAITNIWTEGRKRGALWALAPQPNSGHEFSRTAGVARSFFDSVLPNRLPDDLAGSDDAPPMKAMQESQGWTGDLKTHETQAIPAGSDADRNAAWLPDERSAAAWKQFVLGE
jgi:hypothetical protein